MTTVLVGLEYETLIHVQHADAWNALLQSVSTHFFSRTPYAPTQNTANTSQKQEPNTSCTDHTDVNGDMLLRFVLAAIYQRMQKNWANRIFFHVVKAYHTEPCLAYNVPVNTLLPPTPNAPRTRGVERAKYWQVTPDSSVRLAPTRIPLYHSLQQYLHHEPISVHGPVLEKMELVSPPMSLQDLSEGLLDMVLGHILPAHGTLEYLNNEKTSNHVHLSLTNSKGINLLQSDPMELLKVCMGWWYFEPLWLLLCGHWRRDNIYCEPMRAILLNHLQKDLAQELFYELTPDNHREKFLELDLLDEDSIERYDTGEDDTILPYAVMSLFQGDITQRSSRYAALNLLNLTRGGIGTIEVRIKQGSNDVQENKYFILLFVDFVQALIRHPQCVSEMYSPTYKAFAWGLWDLVSSYQWSERTSLALPQGVFTMWEEFMELVYPHQPNHPVRAYWTHMFTTLHTPAQGGGKNKSSQIAPRRKNKSSQVATRRKSKSS